MVDMAIFRFSPPMGFAPRTSLIISMMRGRFPPTTKLGLGHLLPPISTPAPSKFFWPSRVHAGLRPTEPQEKLNKKKEIQKTLPEAAGWS